MLEIRAAQRPDASAIQAIYAHHALNGTAAFDTEPPDMFFWEQKIATLAERGWPFLVCHEEGRVLGYAYATQFRDRPAYSRTCENSIYMADEARAKGVGTLLLTELVDQAKAAGFEQMIAVIGGGEPASVAVHAKLGFVVAGRMRNVGYKFGRKLDTVYMQLGLCD